MEHAIWTEKFRPKDFSEVKGQKDIVKRVKAFVEQKNMPHLLFAGPAGTGKTSLALVIARKSFKQDWHSNFLELNASDERGIDIIRSKVKDIYDEESDWATLEVVMPVNQMVEITILQLILDRFPNAFPIIRYILGL